MTQPAQAPTGAALLEAVAVMDRLRSTCPWYAEQTHASLAPYAIEEAHEVAEAAETGDGAALADELGDLLLQVLVHARIASETLAAGGSGGFDIDDVARGLVAKLVRRNPHVFAPTGAAPQLPHDSGISADEVAAQWDSIKDAEHGRAHPLDGIPASLPALTRAQKMVSRLRKAGTPSSATIPADAEEPADRIGAALLALVVEVDAQGVDAEAALRSAVRDLESVARGR